MAQVLSSTELEHPLAPLTGAEISAAVALVQAHPRYTEETRFAYVGLVEPTREELRAWAPGDPVDRRVRLMLVTGPEAHVIDAVASLGSGSLSLTDVTGVRPGLLFEESFAAIVALQENARVAGGHAPPGHRGPRDRPDRPVAGRARSAVAHEDGRRICRCLCYVRDSADDNGYARPVEGVVAFVDMARGRGARSLDTGVVPLPPERGSYYPEDVAELRRRSQAARDHPARGPELHRRRQPRALAEMVAPGVDGRRRGPRPARDRLRGPGTGPSRSSTAPR